MTGIYVHIPFCEQKCQYCDFYSIVVSDPMAFQTVVDNYLSAVQKVQYYKDQIRDSISRPFSLGRNAHTTAVR